MTLYIIDLAVKVGLHLALPLEIVVHLGLPEIVHSTVDPVASAMKILYNNGQQWTWQIEGAVRIAAKAL